MPRTALLALGLSLGWLALAAPAAADCTAAQVRAFIAQGLSDAEIDRRCSGQSSLPAWLNGQWHKTEHLTRTNIPGFSSPPITVVWQIETRPDGSLAIVEVHDAHLAMAGLSRSNPLEVRDLRLASGRLSFSVRSRGLGTIRTTHYELLLGPEEDHLTGRFHTRDTGAFGLPPGEMEGTVELVKD